MDENISIWLVGNTGLRSPDRIQDGLQMFAQSPYVGNLHGRENEVRFMNYLDQKGIIQNTEGKDASGSHARKWRLMFARHGFIYPQITRSDGFEQEELGRLDDLTPFGRVFLQADTFPAVQECFLRASSVEQYKMPDGNGYYSPLRWILAIMLELERRTGTSELSRIVNGGQTTYMLHKSPSINSDHDLYLPCKIIRIVGDTEDEKSSFSLSIAKATNSQKAIKPVDLKANSPEQVRFAQAMREAGVFYQTKRGEVVPSQFRDPHLNSDLVEIGKLCLAAVFQVPGTSRNKPSALYQPKYYDPIFNGNQSQIARLCKELLYYDHYFRTSFQRAFDRENVFPNAVQTRIYKFFIHATRMQCI